MTVVTEERIDTVQKLIQSCEEAQQGFRLASASTEDPTLKRLFHIYAHQRSRFADELREHFGCSPETTNAIPSDWLLKTENNDRELIEHCLQADEQALALYRSALRADLPHKAHFLISAQFSLMQRVHERMNNLLAAEAAGRGRVNISTERAML